MKKVLILVLLTLSISSQACTMSPLGYVKSAIKAVMNTIENHNVTIKSIELEERSNVIAVELLSSGRCVRQHFETTLGAACDFTVSRGIHTDTCK